MKLWGSILLIVGVTGLLLALSMDVSVGGYNNIGLINDQRNYMMVSALAIFCGLALVIASMFLPQKEEPEGEEGHDQGSEDDSLMISEQEGAFLINGITFKTKVEAENYGNALKRRYEAEAFLRKL